MITLQIYREKKSTTNQHTTIKSPVRACQQVTTNCSNKKSTSPQRAIYKALSMIQQVTIRGRKVTINRPIYHDDIRLFFKVSLYFKPCKL